MMRRIVIMAGALLISATMTLADEGHTHENHTQKHDHSMMAAGMPGAADTVNRTVEVAMRETDDGAMVFEPAAFDFRTGETVRFRIRNAGELAHEFVLDTPEGNAKHKEMMATMTMEHDDPNALQLEPGESGEVIWTFTNTGTFEFACLIPGHYESGMHGPITVSGDMVAEVTHGTVTQVNVDTGRVTINHGPMPHLGMPSMVMMFHASGDILSQITEGQEIDFIADTIDGKLTVLEIK